MLVSDDLVVMMVIKATYWLLVNVQLSLSLGGGADTLPIIVLRCACTGCYTGPHPQVCMQVLHRSSSSSGVHAGAMLVLVILRCACRCYTCPCRCYTCPCRCYTLPQVCMHVLLIVLRYVCRWIEVKTFPRAQTCTLGPEKCTLHADNLL